MGHMGANSAIMGLKGVNPFIVQYMMIEKQHFFLHFLYNMDPLKGSLGHKRNIVGSKRVLFSPKWSQTLLINK